MARKFEYKMVCKYCGKTFTAYTSVTKYCSATCANRGHKAESEEIQGRNRQKLLSQEYLSLTDAAALLGISRPTLYKLLEDRKVDLLRVSKRTIRVKKSDLLKFP